VTENSFSAAGAMKMESIANEDINVLRWKFMCNDFKRG
jgi:hypothetical protein